MLDSLRFVLGAVAKKDFVAALTHFQIKGGRVKGHNGGLTLCAPIDLDIDVTPKATSFVKAIATCQGLISLNLTAGGRLAVRSGKFRAYVDCVENEQFPTLDPEGDVIELNHGGIYKALKSLHEFIAEDASKQWARGVLFRDQSAFATNNVVLVEHWVGYSFPRSINIPRMAVIEMVRIGEDPIRMQVSENSVTFFYENGSWLKTQLYSLEWPDMSKVLDKDSHPIPPPADLWQALEDIAPFTNKLRQVFFTPNMITTDQVENQGASFEVDGINFDGAYNVDYLLGLKNAIQTIDFSAYPGPARFFGENIRGAIIGMRK